MTTSPAVRPAAVAGLFYPDQASVLRSLLRQLLGENTSKLAAPKALIAPHAAYLYSGPVAASAYSTLRDTETPIQRVVLLGPAHRVTLRGLALPKAMAFRTPLGEIPLDLDAAHLIESLPQVNYSDYAHQLEHSLEVHLPFLQMLLKGFKLVPLLAGATRPEAIAEVLQILWGEKETLVIVSSDLSHYHPYDKARQLDHETARRIESLRLLVENQQACGFHPINGLLTVAQTRRMRVRGLDLRNSADTAGSPERVVGYGAWGFYEA